jgi:hypothetical protein
VRSCRDNIIAKIGQSRGHPVGRRGGASLRHDCALTLRGVVVALTLDIRKRIPRSTCMMRLMVSRNLDGDVVIWLSGETKCMTLLGWRGRVVQTHYTERGSRIVLDHVGLVLTKALFIRLVCTSLTLWMPFQKIGRYY